MKPKMPVLVVVYGIVLMVLGSLTHWLAREGQFTVLLAGGIGGVLCLLIGILGMIGWRYRVATILTLAAISYVLLSQVVIGWLGGEQREAESASVVLLLTVMLVVSVGFVAYFAQSRPEPVGVAER